MQNLSRVLSAPSKPVKAKKGRYFKVCSWGGGYGADLINRELTMHGSFFPEDIVPEKLPLPTPPRYRLRDCSPKKPPRDFQVIAGLWFLTDRAKAVFEQADPTAFVFVRCETEYPKGGHGPHLWICNVIRILDALDRENSQFRLEYNGLGGFIYDFSGSLYRTYCADIVGESKLFIQDHRGGRIICTKIFKDICTTRKISGIRFLDEVKI